MQCASFLLTFSIFNHILAFNFLITASTSYKTTTYISASILLYTLYIN